MPERAPRVLPSLLGYAAVFTVIAWPWLRAASHAIPVGPMLVAPAAARLKTWVLAWVAHALVTPGAHLFDANVSYPAPAQLTGTEHLLSSQLLFAPVFWATQNALLAANAVVLVSYPLPALGRGPRRARLRTRAPARAGQHADRPVLEFLPPARRSGAAPLARESARPGGPASRDRARPRSLQLVLRRAHGIGALRHLVDRGMAPPRGGPRTLRAAHRRCRPRDVRCLAARLSPVLRPPRGGGRRNWPLHERPRAPLGVSRRAGRGRGAGGPLCGRRVLPTRDGPRYELLGARHAGDPARTHGGLVRARAAGAGRPGTTGARSTWVPGPCACPARPPGRQCRRGVDTRAAAVPALPARDSPAAARQFGVAVALLPRALPVPRAHRLRDRPVGRRRRGGRGGRPRTPPRARPGGGRRGRAPAHPGARRPGPRRGVRTVAPHLRQRAVRGGGTRRRAPARATARRSIGARPRARGHAR